MQLRKMADNAFDWAANHGLVRKNEVHQEEEAKLVLKDKFSFEENDTETHNQTAKMVVEDSWLTNAVSKASLTLKHTLRIVRASLWRPHSREGPISRFCAMVEIKPISCPSMASLQLRVHSGYLDENPFW